MKLSIHLLRAGASLEAANVLDSEAVGGPNAFIEVARVKNPPFPCRVYLQANRVTTPSWIGFLTDYFDLDVAQIENRSSSAVILLEAAGRVFAVTFGRGASALLPKRLEPRFGLLVTLNTVDPKKIRTTETRNVDLVTKQRRTHLSEGQSVSEFGINANLDWVRYVAGHASDGALGSQLAGSDGLSVACACSFADLQSKCAELLKHFESDVYKKAFGFVDFVTPLAISEPVVAELEQQLAARISVRSTERLATAYPEMPDETSEGYFRIGFERKHLDTAEVVLERLYAFLDQHAGVEFGKVWIATLEGDGAPSRRKQPARDYLLAEIEHNGELFLTSLGQWFRVAKDFAERVRQGAAAIPDITNQLALPPYDRAEHGRTVNGKTVHDEGAYNAEVGALPGWRSLDKLKLKSSGGTGAVEVCDLISQDKHLVAVKRMTRSATMSHLLAQASVSAVLLRDDVVYRKEVERTYRKAWKGMKFQASLGSPIRFVYGVITSRTEPLHDAMFFFSLVNLVEHARTIRQAGFEVALCRIQDITAG